MAQSRARHLGTAVIALAVLSTGLSGPVQAATTQGLARTDTAHAADQQVTLVTGDRITLYGGDPARAALVRGPGRNGVTFSTQRTKDHFYVVPSDVQEQVADGRLDRRLFDVTGLIKAGYDDRSSTSIPVVVTYAGTAQARSAAPGAAVTRRLPSINGAALKVDKAKAGTFLTGVRSARSTADVQKIWLDGKRQLTLDQSVPQIGAPTAWRAGYTGKGVTVAVLDTGIDRSHPDLATQIAGEKNFTAEADDDLVGHGTHVASTIAGTGAASDGKYRGVAPDAKLYDGKVCLVDGCPESAILGGMEWAANEVKAKVVNLSLGGTDTPELDPLEEAVNRLTAQTGTLFVISAGNDGPGESTVGSPGSADAALTVGAVDKQDQLADFSSRGPRVGDGALKPDVTAPGVDIVAAKAANSVIGEPVGDRYLKLSGTSMAAPHTAGAAAILAQQHPSWKAGDLKAALMASAKPAANQTAFQQGAGRIDLARGIEQSVVTEPSSVSFGTAVWPHGDDTPVTKTLTYRNLGDQPTTLHLTATLAGPGGEPAPNDALTLGATTVTVPAAGTASVQVTSNTNHGGPDGAYSGRITATAGGTTVVTAIGTTKEEEKYELTVNNVAPDGQPIEAQAYVNGVDNDFSRFTYGATTKLRLAKGEYLVDGLQQVGTKVYSVLQPSVSLTQDTTVTLDARLAKPVTITVPNAEATLAIGDVGYERRSASGEYPLRASAAFDYSTQLYSAQIGPPLPAEQLTGHVTSQWAKLDENGSLDNSPYLYAQIDPLPGKYPTGFRHDIKANELAVVDQQINATSDRKVEWAASGIAPYVTFIWTIRLPYKAPGHVKLLVAGSAARWSTFLDESAPDPDPVEPFDLSLSSPPKAYEAGKTYQERLNAAVFAPSPMAASRLGDKLLLWPAALSDADGNKGEGPLDSQSSQLIQDGKVIAEWPVFGRVEAPGLPAAKTTYTLHASQTRQPYSTFSSRIDYDWTFSSAATTEATALPMLGVRYRPTVNRYNVAERKPVTVLPVIVDAAPGQVLPGIRKLEIQVSGDDGKTWLKATVAPTGEGTYKAVFSTPKNARTVSLKAQLTDNQGNVTDQTVIGAYPLG